MQLLFQAHEILREATPKEYFIYHFPLMSMPLVTSHRKCSVISDFMDLNSSILGHIFAHLSSQSPSQPLEVQNVLRQTTKRHRKFLGQNSR